MEGGGMDGEKTSILNLKISLTTGCHTFIQYSDRCIILNLIKRKLQINLNEEHSIKKQKASAFIRNINLTKYSFKGKEAIPDKKIL